jgi:hypothetical protein
MIRQFFRSGSDITWPNFTNARCPQVSHDSLQAYYITTQHVTQQTISLNIENPLLIPLYKITSLQEIYLVKLFIQLRVGKGP